MVPQNSESNVPDTPNPHAPIASTPEPTPSSTHSPVPDSSHPSRTRRAPQHFDPTNFGAHGRRLNFIANVYKDQINGVPEANWVETIPTDFKDIIEFL